MQRAAKKNISRPGDEATRMVGSYFERYRFFEQSLEGFQLESKKEQRAKAEEILSALSGAIEGATEKLSPSRSALFRKALYDHLVLGTPIDMLKRQCRTKAFLKCRDEAIAIAAANLGLA